MSGSAGSRRRSDGAGRISRSDRMVSDLLYVAFKAFAGAGGGEPGDVVAASFKVSVLRAWDAEALGSVSGVSSGAGAAAAGGCGALPGLRAGV